MIKRLAKIVVKMLQKDSETGNIPLIDLLERGIELALQAYSVIKGIDMRNGGRALSNQEVTWIVEEFYQTEAENLSDV